MTHLSNDIRIFWVSGSTPLQLATCFESNNVMNNELDEQRQYWDLRAETFGRQCHGASTTNHYARRFLKLLDVSDKATVLDMGCATGTLAIPLALQGCEVVACDFSPKMIEKLEANVSEKNLPITCKLMAWQDDWSDFGLKENSVDVSIASRSLGYKDVRNLLKKLDSVARETVAITVSAGLIPSYEPRLIEYLGRKLPDEREVPKLIQMIFEMDRYPHLTYIPCERPMRFDDLETARMELARMAGPEPLNGHEQKLFNRYFEEHFKEEVIDGKAVYQLDYTLIAPWAFIKWSTQGNI